MLHLVQGLKQENVFNDPMPYSNKIAKNQDLLTEPMKLRDLIHYQQGSVVSKQLLNKKAGTLTIFAFAKGEGLSEHTAPYDASVMVLEGKAEIKVGGKPHQVGKDAMIIMPAHVPHSLKAVTPFKMLLIMIRSKD